MMKVRPVVKFISPDAVSRIVLFRPLKKRYQGVNMLHRVMWALFVACCAGSLWAGEAEDIANIRERLDQLVPQEPSAIRPAAVEGLYEVMYGTEALYLTGDGRYGLQGDMIDLESGKNLTEISRTEFRKQRLDSMDESQMIVFSPANPRHTLTVFTDVDCAYCQKMHAEMDQFNSYGIAVRYLMFPRSGTGTPSYKKAVSVWCADDPMTAITRAKAGEEIPEVTCDNPVRSQWLSGQEMGVTGTPALFTEDGSLIQGYRPVKKLAVALDSMAEGKPAP